MQMLARGAPRRAAAAPQARTVQRRMATAPTSKAYSFKIEVRLGGDAPSR